MKEILLCLVQLDQVNEPEVLRRNKDIALFDAKEK